MSLRLFGGIADLGLIAVSDALKIRQGVVRAGGFVKRMLQGAKRAEAAAASGSRVTRGPLKVGKQIVYGKPGMTTAAKVAATAASAAGAVGIATVTSHKRAVAPATAPAPRRQPSSSSPTSTDRKCCPAGTKRMVCFKRGRVKGKTPSQQPHASRQRSRAGKARRKVVKKQGSGVPKRPVSAKQAAARKRFAAAAKRGPIQKGSKL